MNTYHFRSATPADCDVIATAIAISSGGYAQIGWQEKQKEFPGLTLLEIGSRMYARDEAPFTWRNCIIAESEQPLGVMLSYGIGPEYASAESTSTDDSDTEDVFYPARLEAPNTWYICGMTVLEPWRGRGIGTRFIEATREQAAKHGYDQLSLLAFEQNQGSVRLYLRNGFEIIDRRRVIPHPLIEYQGDIVLMTAPV